MKQKQGKAGATKTQTYPKMTQVRTLKLITAPNPTVLVWVRRVLVLNPTHCHPSL